MARKLIRGRLMISFKQHIFYEEAREVLETDRVIYKNPTANEWKDIPAMARGLVTKNGDLFVTSKAKTSTGLHRVIHNDVNDTYKIKIKWRNDLVTLHRVGKKKAFMFGESEPLGDWSTEFDDPTKERDPESPKYWKKSSYFKKVKGWLKMAKKKNPGVIFLLQNIAADVDRDANFVWVAI